MSTMRDIVKDVLGTELPISGGNGSSACDPIVITTPDAAEAARVQELVITAIGRIRKALWRTKARARVDGSDVIQHKVERIQVEPDQIVTETVNYYFRYDGLTLEAGALPGAPPSFVEPASGFALPFELGRLHFQGATTSPREAGHEYAVAYGGPGIKATAFVYPRAAGRSYGEEFRITLNALRSSLGPEGISHDWGETEGDGFTFFAFVPTSAPDDISVLYITQTRTHFIKLRATMDDLPHLREAFWDFANDLQDQVAKG